jgi:hypothetical protein
MHLLEHGANPDSGTISIDEKRKMHLLTKVDVVEFVLIYQASGEIQQILKSGKLSKNQCPIRMEPWNHDGDIVRACGFDQFWNGNPVGC